MPPAKPKAQEELSQDEPESRPTTAPAIVSDDAIPVTPSTAERVDRIV